MTKWIRYALTVVLWTVVISGVSGCYQRPVFVDDNTTYSTTLLDVQKVSRYSGLVYRHTYMLCTDAGESLNCRALCGTEDTDYKCPSWLNGQPHWNRFATNTRRPIPMSSAPVYAAPVLSDSEEEEVME